MCFMCLLVYIYLLAAFEIKALLVAIAIIKRKKVAIALYSLVDCYYVTLRRYISLVVEHWTLGNIVYQTRLIDSYLIPSNAGYQP